VIVLSEPKEQEKGLFEELMNRGIECYAIYGIDNLSMRKTILAAHKIGKIIQNNRVDVVHTQGIRQMLVAFIASKIFCRNPKTGITVSVHTTLHGSAYEKVTLLVESLLLNLCADIAMPVAKSVANKLITLGLFPKKVVPVYNGIDLELFDTIMCGDECVSSFPHDFKSSSYIIVGYFATMIQRKGHKYLIKAISEVAKEFPNIRLVITGNGLLRNELETLSKRLGIKDKVLFTGEIEYRSLYQLLRRVAIFAFPSLAELFPFAILEAMAAGKPIVATDVGGVSEAVIDGVNGYLVPPRDPTSLANAILKLINDSEKAKEMGKNSRRLAEEKFNLPKIAYDLTKCYERSLKRVVNL